MDQAIAGLGKYLDLSHIIEHGMLTYKGLPGPVISDFWSREYSRQIYSPGTKFHIGKIEMVANTGTYLDSPYHRFEEGGDLAQLQLESLADLPGIVIRKPVISGRSISEDDFGSLELKGMAVLVNTGWDRRWGSAAYFEGHPYLTRGAAEYLRDSGAMLIGIDSLNIDDTEDGERPVHTILLKAGIPIVEHLRQLHQLPDSGFRFFAVPPKIKGFGSFPVRAFAILK